MSIVQEYLDLTKKWQLEYGKKTIVLYQVGSFLEVYALINPDGTYTGSQIEEFAKINEMVIAKKNICVGKLQVVMAGVGVAYVDKYIQKLQEHDYTIVIYKQEGVGKNITRQVAEIISPGTFFPIETDNLSNNVMCIWLHKSAANKLMPSQVTLGVANIDIYTGRTALFQFAVDYFHSSATYDELERYISMYRPSECLFVANLPEELIDDIIGFVGLENSKIHRINIATGTGGTSSVGTGTSSVGTGTSSVGTGTTLTTFAQNAEKQIYQKEILKTFYPQLALDMFSDHYIATQAFCFLLDFVNQHSPNLIKRLSEPIFENYTDRLLLANHSLSQLNILDDQRHTGRFRSVGSLLNNCVTTMGKRQFLYQLHYPTTNTDVLQRSYDITEHLLQAQAQQTQAQQTQAQQTQAQQTQAQQTQAWQTIRAKLNTISDLEKFSRKIVTRKIIPQNLATLVDDLNNIEQLHAQISSDEVLTDYLPHNDITCGEIVADIERVFCVDACRHLSDINEQAVIINKGISPSLDALQQASLDGRDKLEAIRKYLSEQTDLDSNANSIKIHETAKSDAILMGTSRRVAILKANLQKLAQKTVKLTYQSKYSQTLESFTFDLTTLEYNTLGSNKKDLSITSKQIREIASDNQESKDNLIKAIQQVFQDYIKEFEKFDAKLQHIIQYITQLDLLQCKCFIAHKYNYCKPALQPSADKAFFAFTKIRHPLIEHLQTNELYVTNDLSLGSGSDGILLYGTNAVGKTSFIKSVGIALIMAQAGLYVPCETFTYKPYKSVFTRILGNDNLFKGLSTFAVEMTELRTILTLADENSLVLGDELCSGTESDSALSIFTAGLEILNKRESTFLFATHFHEIVNYEEIKALTKLRMMHMAVYYNKETHVLVYDRKLREGSGDSMYGLEVCKSLNLPADFLQRAHDIRTKYHPEQQSLLALSPSHFNAGKLVGNCEICKKHKASEVHHLQHQKKANESNDYIQTFHKNHVANLLNICEGCHKKIHKTGAEHKVVKTTAGYILRVI